ncbi:MAG TPA: serine--tRNA ligase [Devosiaceae bacterium]|jgi:seryl-tRNA synthetase|nr:serine--tRNA ligase [Devosiaceae bacterium]
MFDIKWIRANPEAFDAALGRRKGDYPKAAELIALDEQRRQVIARLQEAQEQRNQSSKLIGQAKAQKDEAKAQALMAEVAGLKEAIQQGEAEERAAEAALKARLAEIPNLPADDIPTGEDESANEEYFGRNGTPETAAAQRPAKPSFSFTPKEHFETGEALGMMDFEVAAKLSGSRFVVLKSQLARLERAIGQFMLDLHVDHHGYTEVQPPLLVKDDALFGTNQLPKFRDDLFHTMRNLSAKERFAAERAFFDSVSSGGADSDLVEVRNEKGEVIDHRLSAEGMERWEQLEEQIGGLSLIPTAEVPLTNLVRESILAEDELPLRFTALTPCFRSEAGSAGRDTRGMIRQHQFNKVEMVAITTPEASGDEHEKMLSDAEDVLRQLGLHYRVMTLSSGDMGFGAQKTYDLEVWLPGQDAYREISSVSVCGDFQARRMEARYRDGEGKIRHVHTLNGSGVAVGRALIAVMENYQQEDGSIAVPELLQRYMGGLTSIGGRS